MMRSAAGICLLVLAACGESAAPPPPRMPEKAVPAPAAPEASAPKSPPAAAGKKEHVDKKARAKSPELFKKYMTLMEENGELLQSIEEDVEKEKGEALIKPKVQKIVKNAEAARALHYRKNPDEDTELDGDFEIFLLKMEKLRESAWDAESGKKLYEDLGSRCNNCHVKFQ